MDQFNVGDRVKVKHGTAWVPVRAGNKGTVIGHAASGEVCYVRTESCRSYWIDPDDLEPVEEGNGEPGSGVSDEAAG